MGIRIQLARRLAGLSQHRVAHAIGRSPAWLSLVEQGSLTPTAEDIERLADVLSISPAALTGVNAPSNGNPHARRRT